MRAGPLELVRERWWPLRESVVGVAGVVALLGVAISHERASDEGYCGTGALIEAMPLVEGEYIPFEHMLDSVAPCERKPSDIPREYWDGELATRFWLGDGCVAGGHDDIDGDGLRDCWIAQYGGGSGSGGGTFGVNLACLGHPIEAQWSWGRGDNASILTMPGGTSDALVRGVARWVFGPQAQTQGAASSAVRWQIESSKKGSKRAVEVAGLHFETRHTYTPIWYPGSPIAVAPETTILDALDETGDRVVISTEPRVQPELRMRCGNWNVYASDGALAVGDGKRWSRAFVDGFSSVSWLREPLACANGRIIFTTGRYSPYALGVLDPVHGVWTTSEARDHVWLEDGELHVDGEPVDLGDLDAVLD